MAIVWVTLFNAFCFWGPKNTGPNPDHPFFEIIISKASLALGTVGRLLRMSNFFFLGALLLGAGGP